MIVKIRLWFLKRKLQKLFDTGITESDFSIYLEKAGYRQIVNEKDKRVWRNFKDDSTWTITEI